MGFILLGWKSSVLIVVIMNEKDVNIEKWGIEQVFGNYTKSAQSRSVRAGEMRDRGWIMSMVGCLWDGCYVIGDN